MDGILGTQSKLNSLTGRVGTTFYMSPEVAMGWARYSSKVDLYRHTADSLLTLCSCWVVSVQTAVLVTGAKHLA